MCERCNRTVCLECAIPFRGAVRCERCAALELGDPEPAAAPRRRPIRAEHVALGLLLAALGATIPPWHRSGSLTSVLSAWNFGLDGWAAFGCVALAAGALVTLLGLLRPSARSRRGIAALTLSAVSAFAISIALVRAPGFFSATTAPFLALSAAVSGAAATAFSLVRRARP